MKEFVCVRERESVCVCTSDSESINPFLSFILYSVTYGFNIRMSHVENKIFGAKRPSVFTDVRHDS